MTGGRPRPPHRPAVLFALFILGLGACAGGAGGDAFDTDDRLRVVTDFGIVAEFVRLVGADHVAVSSLVPLGADPHVYEPRPSDARAVAQADLVIEHGLGLSPWMSRLHDDAAGATLIVGDAVARRAGQDERDLAANGVLDPHLWLVPPWAALYVEEVAAALGAIDPDHAAIYQANARAFATDIDRLDTELRTAFASIPPQHRLLATPHDAYRYFAAHFGLEILGTLVGITTEEQPSALRVRQLIDDIRASGVPAIFVESTVPAQAIEQVAAEAGVAVAGPIYGDSLGEPGSGADTYLTMMTRNATVIVTALGGSMP